MVPNLHNGGRPTWTGSARLRPFVALVALSLGGVATARAHDPAYAVGFVFADAQSASPEVVHTNRGLIFVDGGDTGSSAMRCAETFGVSTTIVPSLVRSTSGSLLLGFFDGVFRTEDRGCSEQRLGLNPNSAGNLVRVAGDVLLVPNKSSTTPVVYGSDDEGETFTELYTLDQPGYFERLLVAPSDPSRVYAAGFTSKDGMAGSLCGVSEDAGESWTIRDLEAGLKVFAVDPANPDVVFARKPVDIYETIFQVLRSDDACASFEVVLDMVPIPTSLAGPADSDERFLGLRTVGGKGGLYRSAGAGEPFERVLADQIQTVTCLEQRGDRLWICANVLPNTEGVFTSDDGAQTLEPFLTMADVAGPVACDDAEARAVCAGPWYDFYSEVHPNGGAADAGVADGGVVDAGAEDAGADAGGDEPSVDAGEATPAGSGGCSVASGPSRAPGARVSWLLWLGLACAWAARRFRPSAGRPGRSARARTSGPV